MDQCISARDDNRTCWVAATHWTLVEWTHTKWLLLIEGLDSAAIHNYCAIQQGLI